MSVGVDIGSSSIKIVELAKEGTKFRLRNSGIISYSGAPPENLRDDKSMATLANTIRKLKQEAKISKNIVNVSLPESQIFTRVIKFPPLTDREIISAVKWEAEQYIPIPAAEAVIQHQILERRENVSPPTVLVLLIAAPRNVVKSYVKVIELAKMNVASVETDLIALSRSLAPPDKTVLIVDFGAKSTNVAISRQGNLAFSRSINTAGEAFTRSISQKLGIDVPQAERYKRAYGMSPTQLEGKIKNAIDSVFRIVVEEIKKAIYYYQSEEKGEPPKSVILSGGSTNMPELVSMLSRELNLEVVMGNPFARVEVDKNISKSLGKYSPLYSVAVGLAMR